MQRRLVEAFLSAARDGDFDALLAALNDDVVLRVDSVASGAGVPVTVRGVPAVAARAKMFAGNAWHAGSAYIDGEVGLVIAPAGQLTLVLRFGVAEGLITSIDIHADPDRLSTFTLALVQ